MNYNLKQVKAHIHFVNIKLFTPNCLILIFYQPSSQKIQFTLSLQVRTGISIPDNEENDDILITNCSNAATFPKHSPSPKR